MSRIFLITISLLLITACQEKALDPQENTSWAFVANEGNYGSTNGTISMIDDFGNVYETDIIGATVQSIEVYKNKLIVLINGNHEIKIYNINSDGLDMPGIKVSTEDSSPRNLTIVNDKVYFTNWNTQDVKVFNLFNYTIEASIPVQGLPEDIKFDGEHLWVTIPHTGLDFGTANTVAKLDPNTNTLTQVYEVGDGPQEIAFNNGEIYVSRTHYDAEYNAFHGATKISDENGVIINNYGVGAACGGSILSYQANMYRSFDGGLSKMNANLGLDLNNKIGSFNQSQVYHVEENEGNIWFAITDYENLTHEVHVIDFKGDLINSYEVGIFPGDFAFWKK